MTQPNRTTRQTLEALEADLEQAKWTQRRDADAAREQEGDWTLWMQRGQAAVNVARTALDHYRAAHPETVAAIFAERAAEAAIAADEARLRYLDSAAVDGLTVAETEERERLWAAKSARMDAAKADAEARFAAIWTRQETIERRAKWNAGVAAMAAKGGKVSPRQLADHQAAMGFRMEDLKRAVELHDLKGKER
jgi:hypothetical protein